jgi:hypothetical protein
MQRRICHSYSEERANGAVLGQRVGTKKKRPPLALKGVLPNEEGSDPRYGKQSLPSLLFDAPSSTGSVFDVYFHPEEAGSLLTNP